MANPTKKAKVAATPVSSPLACSEAASRASSSRFRRTNHRAPRLTPEKKTNSTAMIDHSGIETIRPLTGAKYQW